jgi:Cd2+/Zn2+-exporting ATPase
LHALGFTTAMLSGDHQTTAETVARTLGIDTVLGALKPEQKVAAIRQLQRERGPVLMVGDGVNDSPALAAATCGAAMGVAGSDAAIEAADLALMADDLRKIPLALAIGSSVRRVSRQNVVLSIAVLVAMIPAAVMGLIGVTTAVIVHEAAELLAVANGLRAGRATAGSRSSNA